MCPFSFFLHPSVYPFPHFKPCLSLSLPNSLLLFLLSPSHQASLSLSPSPSKQRLADGFPITAGTEGLGWLPHVNVWAPTLNISSTQSRREGRDREVGGWSYVKVTQTAKKIRSLKGYLFPLIYLNHTIHILWGYVHRLTPAASCSWADNGRVDTCYLQYVSDREEGVELVSALLLSLMTCLCFTGWALRFHCYIMSYPRWL